MRAIKNILLIMTLTVIASCATRTKVTKVEPIKKSRMQRLIECTKGLLEDDVTPIEASNICESFLNSRRK